MLMEILLGIFIVTFIIGAYIVRNLIKKIERLEDWVENYTQKIYGAYIEMKLLDDRGIFEADDEVGDVFSKLKDVTEQLNKEGVIEENAS
tara:strand:- start:278 stop:547 length:270 start_codon:yes stop_codon:yes gene_type:complete